LKNNYKYYKHKDFSKLKVKTFNQPNNRSKIFYYPKGANKRVILFGTSMNENLSEFIPFTFKDVKRIRNNEVTGINQVEEWKILKHYKKTILEYKPDIFILCFTITNILDMPTMFLE